jgi:GGDEF domain-containing protein
VLAARRIIAALVAPVMIGGKEVHPRASIGVVSGQLGALHPETLLADADLATCRVSTWISRTWSAGSPRSSSRPDSPRDSWSWS